MIESKIPNIFVAIKIRVNPLILHIKYLISENKSKSLFVLIYLKKSINDSKDFYGKLYYLKSWIILLLSIMHSHPCKNEFDEYLNMKH